MVEGSGSGLMSVVLQPENARRGHNVPSGKGQVSKLRVCVSNNECDHTSNQITWDVTGVSCSGTAFQANNTPIEALL